jgi:phosphotransferase system enzyme I (PtsI)
MKELTTGVITGGISIGNAFVYKPSLNPAYVPGGPEEESGRFRCALEEVKIELSGQAESNEIFAAHYEMADDPMLEEQAAMLIEDGISAYGAILQTSDALCVMFD